MSLFENLFWVEKLVKGYMRPMGEAISRGKGRLRSIFDPHSASIISFYPAQISKEGIESVSWDSKCHVLVVHARLTLILRRVQLLIVPDYEIFLAYIVHIKYISVFRIVNLACIFKITDNCSNFII